MDTDNDGEFYSDMNRAMTGIALVGGLLIGGLLLYVDQRSQDNNRNQNVPVEARR